MGLMDMGNPENPVNQIHVAKLGEVWNRQILQIEIDLDVWGSGEFGEVCESGEFGESGECGESSEFDESEEFADRQVFQIIEFGITRFIRLLGCGGFGKSGESSESCASGEFNESGGCGVFDESGVFVEFRESGHRQTFPHCKELNRLGGVQRMLCIWRIWAFRKSLGSFDCRESGGLGNPEN